MKCEICGTRVPEDNYALFRVNPLGEIPAIWRCAICLIPAQRDKVDLIDEDIAMIIQKENLKKA